MSIVSESANLALLPCLLGNLYEMQSASRAGTNVHEVTPETLSLELPLVQGSLGLK